MEETQSNSKKPRIMWETGRGTAPPTGRSSSYKTQLCRRFMEGACPLGSKCTYAHGVADLRRSSNHLHPQEPKLCRMFSFNKHCTYGHNCRFLHSISSSSSAHTPPQLHHQFNNAPFDPHAHPQPQPGGGGKYEGYSSVEYRAMQTFTAAANASITTVATSSLQKNEQPYRVKFIFKENELQKISGIYADWI